MEGYVLSLLLLFQDALKTFCMPTLTRASLFHVLLHLYKLLLTLLTFAISTFGSHSRALKARMSSYTAHYHTGLQSYSHSYITTT
jgi:hypothetical protein